VRPLRIVSITKAAGHRIVRARRREWVLEALGAVVSSVGTDKFYPALFELFGHELGCGRWLLVRYSRFARPEILINRSLSLENCERYLNGLYRLDPLLRLVSRGDVPPVVTFQQSHVRDANSEAYDDLFRMCLIRDELAIMMPDIGGTYLALCFDSDRRSFTSEDRLRCKRLFPIAESLHRLHIERNLAHEVTFSENGGATRMVVTDAKGQLLHRSSDWDFPEREQVDRIISEVSRGVGTIAPVRVGKCVLHWEALDTSHALAPGGRIFLLENRSPGYLTADVATSLASFATANRLSPRELEIVKLTMRGYSTHSIARRLGLTDGTVKNYKHRLYEKLDITSEREIFRCFIAHLFGQHDDE
jgi:DNA-binding CsgD family transcriptional regulator